MTDMGHSGGLAEFVAAVIEDGGCVPYEVLMASHEASSAVAEWTEARRRF